MGGEGGIIEGWVVGSGRRTRSKSRKSGREWEEKEE